MIPVVLSWRTLIISMSCVLFSHHYLIFFCLGPQLQQFLYTPATSSHLILWPFCYIPHTLNVLPVWSAWIPWSVIIIIPIINQHHFHYLSLALLYLRQTSNHSWTQLTACVMSAPMPLNMFWEMPWWLIAFEIKGHEPQESPWCSVNYTTFLYSIYIPISPEKGFLHSFVPQAF